VRYRHGAQLGAERERLLTRVENDTGEEVVAESLSMPQTANLPSAWLQICQSSSLQIYRWR
jgi:hypothetical protein